MKKTNIGGQALIEGLMMIGPENAAIALRKADGEILVEKRPLPKKLFITKIPIIRGAINFFRQMVLGMKALMFSAQFLEIEEEEEEDDKPSKFDNFLKMILGEKRFNKLNEKFEGNKIPDFMIYISVVISILFSVVLFFWVPNLIAELVGFDKSKSGNIYYNLFEGVIRMTIFSGYIILVSKMEDIKRVWQYHGAEHKTIHCYENGRDLSIENVKSFSTKHPRCGTSFMIIVMVVSVIVFSILPRGGIIENIMLRLVFIPLVAGVSYELLKFAGKRSDWQLMKIINAPGLAFQYFTTREPDDEQIEVAIEAFNNVLVDDKEADNW
ncbi:MAG: DUF1385 domain-containing protein [Clostridiales bacterium]